MGEFKGGLQLLIIIGQAFGDTPAGNVLRVEDIIDLIGQTRGHNIIGGNLGGIGLDTGRPRAIPPDRNQLLADGFIFAGKEVKVTGLICPVDIINHLGCLFTNLGTVRPLAGLAVKELAAHLPDQTPQQLRL